MHLEAQSAPKRPPGWIKSRGTHKHETYDSYLEGTRNPHENTRRTVVEQKESRATKNANADIPTGNYRERPDTTLELLAKKLHHLKETKVRNKQIRDDVAEAERLFEQLKEAHPPNIIDVYDKTLEITEGLETARHLANAYDQLDIWRADSEIEDHPLADKQFRGTPADLREKAKADLKASRDFSKRYAEAYKHLNELNDGRQDKDAQKTKGLEGDDVTLSYGDRLELLEKKVRERFKTITKREATDEEFDRLVYRVKNGFPSPLSITERMGQGLRRLGELTLGKVSDVFSDRSIQEAINQYTALETAGNAAVAAVEKVEAEKAQREAYAKQLQARAQNLDGIRATRKARIEKAKALADLPTEAPDDGAALNEEKALERKRRLLAREQMAIEKRDRDAAFAKEKARLYGDTAGLKALNAKRDYGANDAERDEAATEAFEKANREEFVAKRIRQWRKQQNFLKSFGEEYIEPDSTEGEAAQSKIREEALEELRKQREKILAREGGTEDLFFGEEDALEERRKKKTTIEEPIEGKKPAKAKKNTEKKGGKPYIISEANSGNYTLEGADIPYPEKPITVGDVPDQDTSSIYTLDKEKGEEELSFVMGEEPKVEEKPFTLRRAELSIRPKSELQKGEERKKREASTRQEELQKQEEARTKRERENQILSWFLQEFRQAAEWKIQTEADLRALAEKILSDMEQQTFERKEIQDALLEFSSNQSSFWRDQSQKQTGRTQKGAINKLLMIEMLDSLLQPPEATNTAKPNPSSSEQPPIPTRTKEITVYEEDPVIPLEQARRKEKKGSPDVASQTSIIDLFGKERYNKMRKTLMETMSIALRDGAKRKEIQRYLQATEARSVDEVVDKYLAEYALWYSLEDKAPKKSDELSENIGSVNILLGVGDEILEHPIAKTPPKELQTIARRIQEEERHWSEVSDMAAE